MKAFAAAETQLREVIKKDDNLTAHMYLGVTISSLKRYDEAEKDCLSRLACRRRDTVGTQAHNFYWVRLTLRKGRSDQARAVDWKSVDASLPRRLTRIENTEETIKNLRANP